MKKDKLNNKELFHKDNIIENDKKELEPSERQKEGARHHTKKSALFLKRDDMEHLGSISIHYYKEKSSNIIKMTYNFDYAILTNIDDVPEKIIIESFRDLKNKAKIVFGRE